MKKVNYEKRGLLAGKRQGLIRQFDIDNLPKGAIATNDEEIVRKYLHKKDIYVLTLSRFDKSIEGATDYIILDKGE